MICLIQTPNTLPYRSIWSWVGSGLLEFFLFVSGLSHIFYNSQYNISFFYLSFHFLVPCFHRTSHTLQFYATCFAIALSSLYIIYPSHILLSLLYDICCCAWKYNCLSDRIFSILPKNLISRKNRSTRSRPPASSRTMDLNGEIILISDSSRNLFLVTWSHTWP